MTKEGKRRPHKVTILRRKEGIRNALNEPSVTHEDTETKWANVKPLTARERVYAAANGMQTTHRITLLFTEDMSEEDKISFRGRIFHIDGIINPDEANRELVITAYEGGE